MPPTSKNTTTESLTTKLLYTWRDQTRGNVVAGGRGNWGGDTAAIRGPKYGKKVHLDNYFRSDQTGSTNMAANPFLDSATPTCYRRPR